MPLARNLGVVTELPSPYRIPLFNALHERLDGRLHVFFLSERAGRDWPVHRSEMRFAYDVVGGVAMLPGGPGAGAWYLTRPILGALRRRDVGPLVVGGYNHLAILWALAHGRRRRQPVVLWSESVGGDGGRRARDRVKRLVVSSCQGFVVPGTRAARQLEALGAPPERVAISPNSVDVEYWSADPASRDGDAGEPSLLFVGHLIAAKGLEVLLEALDDDRLRHLRLDVAGAGPDAARLRERAAETGLNVAWHGFLQRERLRDLYRAADVLVVPTLADCWGLVLNEGMLAGCVPVASSAAGAVGDLVEAGKSGVVVPPGDPAALRGALLSLLADPGRRRALGRAAADRARGFTPEAAADGFLAAVALARA
jgi:glycosyltransferase involved in cell wall biosynthesis